MYSALHAFAGGKNIKLEDVLAFGNEITDMEMLRNVGCGIAVCNAPKYVKDNVKYIADSYNDDGVAKALLKILDIK